MNISQFYILAFITSLSITFVFAAMKEGGILFWLRRTFDFIINPLPTNAYLFIRKPLYECLTCMSSLWGILFTLPYFELSWQYLQLLFVIGGFNYIIECLTPEKEEA